MPEYLKRLLMKQRYLEEHEDEENAGGAGGGAGDDDDDDDDEPAASSAEVKVGEQEDGSVVIELEEGEADQNAEPATEPDADDELTAKREARRQERQDRKNRQKEREESQRRELAQERRARQELEKRLNALEGNDQGRRIAQVDEEIKALAISYNDWKAKLEEAHEQHDGKLAAAATEKMFQARERFENLKHTRQSLEESGKRKPAPADPAVADHAQQFLKDHSWYKSDSSDVDSSVLKTIDNALAAEGRNPADPEYWQELRARVKKYLPHRVASGKVSTSDAPSGGKAPTQRQSKSVVSGGSGTQAGASKKTITLSADRVKAIKEAGMWDDPKQRNEMIKSYQQYDKQNKG